MQEDVRWIIQGWGISVGGCEVANTWVGISAGGREMDNTGLGISVGG